MNHDYNLNIECHNCIRLKAYKGPCQGMHNATMKCLGEKEKGQHNTYFDYLNSLRKKLLEEKG